MKYLMALSLLVSGIALADSSVPQLGEWSKDKPPCTCISAEAWAKKSEAEKTMVRAQFNVKKGN
ncbi:MAG: hypothetical protein KA715_04520 [Xanthomonadaceae bacterium]|nr:hypothetical protein [Xanthomonadaceae bacterium]